MTEVTTWSRSRPALEPDPGTTSAERARLEEVAHEFEALLLLQMLRQMRQSILDPDEGNGDGHDALVDTIDAELARHLSRYGGIGVARLMQAFRWPEPATNPPVVGTAMENPMAEAIAPAPSVESAARAGFGGPSDPVGGPVGRSAGSGEDAGRTVVTSPYGWRRDPFTGARRYHAGVDLAAAYGQPVPAASAGRVVHAGEQGNYGTTVVVEHEPGVQTRYAHLSSVEVNVGQLVGPGETVGRVGQSGRATGPHLHFEVIRLGQRVPPDADWMAALKKVGLVADSRDGRPSGPIATGAAHEN